MRVIRISMIGFSMLIAGTGLTRAESLRFAVAAEPYPPFASKTADGKWQGFEVDLINRLCARMETDCEIKEVAWDGIIPALLAKKIDVIFASMSITAERQKQIAFTRAYYDTPVAAAAPETLKFDLSTEGMKGLVIGVQMATTSASFVKAHFEGVSEIRYYDTQDAANSDLLAGRLDLIIADATAVKAFTDRPDVSQSGIVTKGEVPYDPIFGKGIGAGLRHQDTELKERLDQAIQAETNDPEYETLSNTYFGINVKPKS